MEQLIRISEQNGKQAVSARELHYFLESKRDFSNWIKDRISKYGLIEKQDYEVFANFVENPSGGRPLTEYALTLDCAKELAMVEGNAKGKQARQYFIACENKLKEVALSGVPVIQNDDETIMIAMQVLQKRILESKQRVQMLEGTNEALEQENKQLAPLAKYTNEVLQSTSTYTMTEVAKEFGMSAHTFGMKLHLNGIMFYQSGRWMLTCKYQDKGYTTARTALFTHSDGRPGSKTSTVWTESGRAFLHSLKSLNSKSEKGEIS